MLKRIFLAIAFPFSLFGIGLLFMTTAFACSCLPPAPPIESLKESDYVFTGTVTSVQLDGELEVKVAFNVDSVFKASFGELDKNINIITPRDTAACGVNFEEGIDYIIYASRVGSVIQTNLCTRTAPIANATDDLTDLEAYIGDLDSNLAIEDESENNALLIFAGAVAAVAVLGSASYFLYRANSK